MSKLLKSNPFLSKLTDQIVIISVFGGLSYWSLVFGPHIIDNSEISVNDFKPWTWEFWRILWATGMWLSLITQTPS